MGDAAAIVRSLVESPEDGLDWEHDPEDPDQIANLGSALRADFPGSGQSEPLVRDAERFRHLAKAHRGGFTQRTGFYRPGSYMYNTQGEQPYFTFPHGALIHKLDNRTFMVFWPDGALGLQVHGTVVLKRSSAGDYSVNAGGHKTRLTWGRLDEYLPFGWRLFHKLSEGEFYWFNQATRRGAWDDPSGLVLLFTDGDVIRADGWLEPQAEVRYRRKRKVKNEPPGA